MGTPRVCHVLFGLWLIIAVPTALARVLPDGVIVDKDDSLPPMSGSSDEHVAAGSRSLLGDNLPPFTRNGNQNPDVPDDAPIKKGHPGTNDNVKGYHFSLEKQADFQRGHGNTNWPHDDVEGNGNGNGNAYGNGNGNGKGNGNGNAASNGACAGCYTPKYNYKMSYHNGSVMFATNKFPTLTTYVIFYGPASAWSPVTPQVNGLVSIVTNLLANIGNSSYFQINQGNMGTVASATAGYYYLNSAYNGGNKAYPPNTVGNPAFGGYMFDGSYTPGKVLADADIQAIIANAVNSSAALGTTATPVAGSYPPQYTQGLPLDGSGIYFVITDPSVQVNGMCSQFCGYHSYYSQNVTANSTVYNPTVSLKYAFVGNAANCLSSCARFNLQTSPNGYPAFDALASIVAHEFVETVTDPNLDAWYDLIGQENADKCAFIYNATGTPLPQAPNGAFYNANFGGMQYLIQMNYVNLAPTGYCAMTYGYTGTAPVYP